MCRFPSPPSVAKGDRNRARALGRLQPYQGPQRRKAALAHARSLPVIIRSPCFPGDKANGLKTHPCLVAEEGLVLPTPGFSVRCQILNHQIKLVELLGCEARARDAVGGVGKRCGQGRVGTAVRFFRIWPNPFFFSVSPKKLKLFEPLLPLIPSLQDTSLFAKKCNVYKCARFLFLFISRKMQLSQGGRIAPFRCHTRNLRVLTSRSPRGP